MHPCSRYLFIIILIALTLTAGAATSGTLYVWTDENGIRHFSNIAPPLNGKISWIRESVSPVPQGQAFRVIKVYDGDTVQVSGAGIEFRIRLAGIDTPETGGRGRPEQPFAKQGKQVLTALVLDKNVTLKQYGTGSYNRVLAELFIGRRNINLAMVQNGLAEVYRGTLPKGLDTAAYKRAQHNAKARGIGMWALGRRYKSPKQWRKEHPMK